MCFTLHKIWNNQGQTALKEVQGAQQPDVQNNLSRDDLWHFVITNIVVCMRFEIAMDKLCTVK